MIFGLKTLKYDLFLKYNNEKCCKCLWEKLFTDSVSVNKKYLTDTLSVNKKYLTDSGVPIEKKTR